MDKKDEALKLAREALEYISSHYMSLPKIGCMALAAVEEALAEQPAQQDIPKIGCVNHDCAHAYADGWNACVRAHNETPSAQQEPVATDWERIARVQDAKLRAMCNEHGGFEKLCEVMEKYERASPPASKPWVGLTEEQKVVLCKLFPDHLTFNAIDAIEAKLREKNQ